MSKNHTKQLLQDFSFRPLTLVKSMLLVLTIIIWSIEAFPQSDLKKVDIGTFKTTEGEEIDNATIAYRTIGEINKDSTNVIVWPTWFTGTSKDVIDYARNTIDTTAYFVIAVDAFGNGVSSSPSNDSDFPTISIRDMVNSQHTLLKDYMGINSFYAIMGISMGGMQALEWAVAYPQYSEKIISISGTPNPSFYDVLDYQTMADLIIEAGDSKTEMKENMKRVYDIFWMNAATPAFLNYQNTPDSLNAFRIQKYDRMIHPLDYLSGLKAMINHNIGKENKGLETSEVKPEPDMLIVVSPKDRLVTPQNSLSLAEDWNTELLILDGDCGHGAAWCEITKIKNKLSEFLEDSVDKEISKSDEDSN